MARESVPDSATPFLSTPVPDTAGRGTRLIVFLLGAALPIQWYAVITGVNVNLCAADVFLLPAAFLLRKQWSHSAGLGRWLFFLWVINLTAWMASLSVLTSTAFLREMMKVVTCYCFALIGYGIGCNLRLERILVKGMVLSSLPIAAIAIQSFFTRWPPIFIPDGRVSGLFTDPNAFGVYLALLITLVMSLRIDLVAIPLFIGAGMVSFSRTGFIGMGVSMLLGMTHAKVRRYLPIIVLGVVMGLILWSNIWSHTVGLRVMEYESSLDERKTLWNQAYQVAADHPIIGIGRGNWEFYAARHTLPHNTLLSVAVDVGLIGVAIFITPLLVWLGKGVRYRATRPWAIVLLINLLGGLSISLDNFRPFWLCTGVLVAQISYYEQLRREQRNAYREAMRITSSSPYARSTAPQEAVWE